MKDNWQAAVAAVWQFDGIKEDRAPGEAFDTAYGITQSTWNDACDDGVIVPLKLFADITPDDAKTILKANYWDKCRCDDLPAGVDLQVFAFAMLAGVREAIISLQMAVAVDDDGVIGPITLAAVASRYADVKDCISRVFTENLDYLRLLQKWYEFHNGWTRRESTMMAAADKLAGVS